RLDVEREELAGASKAARGAAARGPPGGERAFSRKSRRAPRQGRRRGPEWRGSAGLRSAARLAQAGRRGAAAAAFRHLPRRHAARNGRCEAAEPRRSGPGQGRRREQAEEIRPAVPRGDGAGLRFVLTTRQRATAVTMSATPRGGTPASASATPSMKRARTSSPAP